MDDEYQGVVSQASFAMQGPLEVPIVNAIVSRLHCGSLVIDVYVFLFETEIYRHRL